MDEIELKEGKHGNKLKKIPERPLLYDRRSVSGVEFSKWEKLDVFLVNPNAGIIA